METVVGGRATRMSQGQQKSQDESHAELQVEENAVWEAGIRSAVVAIISIGMATESCYDKQESCC